MEKRTETLKALKHQIAMALDQGVFSPELTHVIGAYCRKRRTDGRTPAYIAEELGISEWQVADWSAQKVQEERPPLKENTSYDGPLMFTLNLPFTYRFERLLTREIARSMQTCDSCCWKQLIASLPGEFTVDKEEEQS